MVTLTKVNLSERTRIRLNAESNQQRAAKPHDIRGAVPLVDYTNPAKFPPYVYREYPKMPLLDGNKPIVIDESGGVLVFYDAADEVDFRDMNPELAEEIERNTPAKTLSDAIAAKDAEIEGLRARLRSAGVEDMPAKPKKNVVANAVRPPHAGLRGALPRNRDVPSPQGAAAVSAPGDVPITKNPLKKKKH